MRALRQGFVAGLPERLAAMRAAVRADDRAALQHEAHRLAGTGVSYGLPQLTTFGTLLFYNQPLFDQAGVKYPPVDWDDTSWTFDAMLDAAKRLTKNPGETVDLEYLRNGKTEKTTVTLGKQP